MIEALEGNISVFSIWLKNANKSQIEGVLFDSDWETISSYKRSRILSKLRGLIGASKTAELVVSADLLRASKVLLEESSLTESKSRIASVKIGKSKSRKSRSQSDPAHTSATDMPVTPPRGPATPVAKESTIDVLQNIKYVSTGAPVDYEHIQRTVVQAFAKGLNCTDEQAYDHASSAAYQAGVMGYSASKPGNFNFPYAHDVKINETTTVKKGEYSPLPLDVVSLFEKGASEVEDDKEGKVVTMNRFVRSFAAQNTAMLLRREEDKGYYQRYGVIKEFSVIGFEAGLSGTRMWRGLKEWSEACIKEPRAVDVTNRLYQRCVAMGVVSASQWAEHVDSVHIPREIVAKIVERRNRRRDNTL